MAEDVFRLEDIFDRRDLLKKNIENARKMIAELENAIVRYEALLEFYNPGRMNQWTYKVIRVPREANDAR